MLHIALGSDVRTPCVRLPFMSLDTDDGTVLRGVLKESILGTGAFGQVNTGPTEMEGTICFGGV